MNDTNQAFGKIRCLDTLMTRSDILLVQETHGDELEADHLSGKWENSHTFFFSHGITRNKGGLFTAIKRQWAMRFEYVFGVDIIAGRCSALFCLRRGLTLIVANIHIPPQWLVHEKKSMLQKLRDIIPSANHVAFFILGDFNFGFDPLAASDIPGVSGSSARASVGIESFWHHIFPEASEIYQDLPTCKSGDCLFRLDRCYSCLPLSFLLDLKAELHVAWTHAHELAKFSDHIPIALSGGQSSGVYVTQLPRWVSHSLHYPIVCQELLDQTRIPKTFSAGQRLLVLKDIIVQAANVYCNWCGSVVLRQ